ncbi:restriction endonuclease subunit S [Nocardiopsis algeriensis]|uniref:restriction endonuclease subunit S n=1 Tax=Nocardiopsis algeriensis TaxID=1478215 RepID=UPI003B43135E
MTEGLPEGWASATLAELGQWYGGATPSKARPEFWENGTIPWISPKDMGQEVLTEVRDSITQEALNSSPVRLVPSNSVAFVVRSGILERKFPVALTTGEATLNQDMKAIHPYEGVDARWIAWGLRWLEQEILEKCRKAGTTVASIATKRLQEATLPLPPLAEQHRILDALETEISRAKSADQDIIKSLRNSESLWNSVLSGVISGSLVNKIDRKYDLTPIEQHADVQGGIQKQAKRRPVKNKYPFLRVANVHRGKLELSEVHEVELFEGELERYRLQPGDLLVVEGNGSRAHIGRGATWHGNIENCVHQNHLIRLRPGPHLRPEYLELAWNSPFIGNQLRSVASSTSGLLTLSVSKIKKIKIPIPSLEEQDRLVFAANEWRSKIDAARISVQKAQRQSATLQRALLAAAFTGQLAPQSPSDEPASVLLERIRAEHAATSKLKRGHRNPIKSSGGTAAKLVEAKAAFKRLPNNPQPVSAGEQTALEF